MANERGSIVQEPFGEGLVKTYDKLGYYILQNETNIKYTSAIDVPNRYTYSETNDIIPPDIEPEYVSETVKVDNSTNQENLIIDVGG